jgi:lipoprotein-releasing system permease protein
VGAIGTIGGLGVLGGALIALPLLFLIGLFAVLPWAMGLRLNVFISVVSVCIGVAALIIVIALLDGVDANLHRRYMDMIGHVQARPTSDDPTALVASPEAAVAALQADPRVAAAAPRLVREAFLLQERNLGGAKSAVQLIGLDPEGMREVAPFVDHVILGTGEPGPGEVVLGRYLAGSLFARPGDSIWAITRLVIDAHGLPHERWQRLRVAGIFETGIPELDSATAYTSLGTAREAFLLPGDAVSGVLMRVHEPHRARDLAEELEAAHADLGLGFQSWDATNPAFFFALQLERVGVIIMLLTIVTVASFNIISTLVMIVTERTREIGILKTMGASDAEVRRIFLRSGLWIGLVGTGMGLALGLATVAAIPHIPLNLPLFLPGLETLPVKVDPLTTSLIAGASILICLLASVVPAQSAARHDPIIALRHE